MRGIGFATQSALVGVSSAGSGCVMRGVLLLVLAQDDGQLFLGDDFFPWMVLAFGAAMVVGNVMALLRPPADGGGAPVGRAGAMIALGLVASVWGLASLLG